MTFEMYNNDFHLEHAFCVIFFSWPRSWPHALMASLTSLHSACNMLVCAPLCRRSPGPDTVYGAFCIHAVVYVHCVLILTFGAASRLWPGQL